MSYASAIEWTDATWNPVRGCTKISPGCRHCYASVFAERWRGVPGHPYEFGFDLRLVPEKLIEPLTWKQPRKVFVNSMSDLFQDGVPQEFILRSFEVMFAADWHTFQILTKRPERMKTLVQTHLPALHGSRHIWLGVSVEDRQHGAGFSVKQVRYGSLESLSTTGQGRSGKLFAQGTSSFLRSGRGVGVVIYAYVF